MRWQAQGIDTRDEAALPTLARISGLLRTVTADEFPGVRFHEVAARSALNAVPGESAMPFRWTINPFRGCEHACVYCFARGSHSWLELDSGTGFDREIVVKVNVVEVLQRELARPSWGGEHVALGTNTDPYQRAEGRYRLMPGVIGALARSGTPLSVLTKGTLLRRDLPELVAAARDVPVGLGVSVAVHDEALHSALEPGTPTPRARLALVRAVREAGLPCGVFLAPVLPWLTDSHEDLDRALTAVAQTGATGVTVLALHLRPGAREWFMAWLARERADLVPRYEELYGRHAYVPVEYRRWLSARVAPLLHRHGLDREAGSERVRSSGDQQQPGDQRPGGEKAKWVTRGSSSDARGRWPSGSLPAGPGASAGEEHAATQLALLPPLTDG